MSCMMSFWRFVVYQYKYFYCNSIFTLGGHDRDGGTINGSGDSRQTTSTRDRGDSIIGAY